MNKTLFHLDSLRSDIKKLRLLLILLTIIEVSILCLILFDGKVHLYTEPYGLYKIIWVWDLIVKAIFIWYNWQRLPIERKKKYDNTWMILFLGIIGMWLWMPNKEEINKMMAK